MRPLDSHEATKIAGTESAGGVVFWSPSGDEIAFQVKRELKRVAFDGRAPSKICSCVLRGAWSTTGVIVGTDIWGEGLHRVDASGGEPVPLTRLDASKREAVHLSPFFFPDGNRFAFLGRTALGVNSEIYIASLDDPTPRRDLSADGLNGILAGNMLLFAREGRLLAQEVDLDSANPIGDEVTVVDRIHYNADAAMG